MFKGSRTQAVAPGSDRAQRPMRGLGPFSGTQLTIILVSLIVVIGLPVGAFAVSGTNSFITDAVSGTHATVNSKGRLATSAAVTGLVESQPASFVRGLGTVHNSDNCALVYTAPSTRAVVIKTLVLNTIQYTADATGTPLVSLRINDPTCGDASGSEYVGAFSVAAGPGQSVTPFEPGFAIPAGKSLYADEIDVSFAGSITTEVTVFGYSLPAATCSPGC